MAEKSNINLEILKLSSCVISDASKLDIMAGQVTQILTGSLGILGASLFILNPEKNELEMLANTGLSADYVNKGPVLIDKSMRLKPNREPMVIADVSKSSRLQYPEDAKKEGIRAIVSLPVSLRGKVIGALRLYHGDVWNIDDEELDFLKVIAQSIGMGIMYFRLAAAVQAVRATVSEIHPVWL